MLRALALVVLLSAPVEARQLASTMPGLVFLSHFNAGTAGGWEDLIFHATMTAVGSTAAGVTGRYDKGITYANTTGFKGVRIETTYAPSFDSWTLGQWMRTTYTAGYAHSFWHSYGNTEHNAAGKTVTFTALNSNGAASAAGWIEFIIYDYGSAFWCGPVAYVPQIFDGKWHLVTMTYGSRYVKVQVDGVEAAVSAQCSAGAVSPLLYPGTNMGATSWNGSYIARAADVDEAFIFSRVLYAGELRALYRDGIGGRNGAQ